MKIVTLLFAALLLTVVGAQATTVRTYFRVGDSNFGVNFWPWWEENQEERTGWKYNSYDVSTGEIYLDKDGNAAGWTLSNVDLTEYSKLVVKLVPQSVSTT